MLRSFRSTLLRKGVPEREVPDMIQESFTAAFRCKNLPDDDAAARQYLFGIVRKKAKKLLRDWHNRNHEPFDEVQMEGSDPRAVRGARPAPENRRRRSRQPLAVVRVVHARHVRRVARRHRPRREPRLRDGARALRADAVDLRRWATQIAAGIAVLLFAIGVYRLLHPHSDEIATRAPRPLCRPVPPSLRPRRSRASTTRRSTCADGRQAIAPRSGGIECQGDLDEAKVRDPVGETDRAVIELRRQVRQARERSSPQDKPPSP